MTISTLRHGAATCMAAVLVLCAATGFAQSPASDRPLRTILPVGPGSGVDTIMRTVSPSLSKALGGQPVVIENMAGAGGITGTQAIVKAPADGQTIGVVSNNHVINPSVYKKMPYDSINDITPIMVIGTTPLVLVVNPNKLPVKDVKEFVAALKARPDAYNYASSGNGTILHLAAEMFLDQAGVASKHIPYKGVGPMVTDIMGGQVDWGVVALPSVQGHLKTGSLRAIGIGTAVRVPAAPEIPTMAEQGMPNYLVDGWFAVIGPPKLPATEVKEAMARQGNVINPSSPEAAVAFFKSEQDKYAKLVQKAGVKID